MPLEKLQEMINQKLSDAKHKYSAVMKYSITTNWSWSLILIFLYKSCLYTNIFYDHKTIFSQISIS